MENKIKSTSFEYDFSYQENQANKYRNRASNHWRFRIQKAFDLFDQFKSEFSNQKSSNISVLDVGCSSGTFAIEFAKRGFKSIGIDFDPESIKMAKILAKEEFVTPEFICDDVSNLALSKRKFKVIVCFDIFEHLHQDELGSLLVSLRKLMEPDSILIFHTYPSKYTNLLNIFFTNKMLRLLVLMLSETNFRKTVKFLYSLNDAIRLIFKGQTYEESIKKHDHCRLYSIDELQDIFLRSKYRVRFIESNDLYLENAKYSKNNILNSNLYGVLSLES